MSTPTPADWRESVREHSKELRALINGDENRRSLVERAEALDWDFPMIDRISQVVIGTEDHKVTYTAPRGWFFKPERYQINVNDYTPNSRSGVQLSRPSYTVIGEVTCTHGTHTYSGIGRVELSEYTQANGYSLRAQYRKNGEWREFGKAGCRHLAHAVGSRFIGVDMNGQYWKILAREAWRLQCNHRVHEWLSRLHSDFSNTEALIERAEAAI
jgi:hypothetical protein